MTYLFLTITLLPLLATQTATLAAVLILLRRVETEIVQTWKPRRGQDGMERR